MRCCSLSFLCPGSGVHLMRTCEEALIILLLWAVWKVLARQQDLSPLPFSLPSCLRMRQLEKWPAMISSLGKGESTGEVGEGKGWEKGKET